jgi:thioredoxin
MAQRSTITTCPNCATKNRVRPSPSGVPRCSVCQTLLPWIVEAGPDTFDEEITSSVPALVDFWAPWCGPCRVVAPVLEEIASERPDLRIVKLNTDENQQTAAAFQVLSIPTMILFKGGQPVKTVIGAYPKKKLEQELEPALA